MKFDIPVSKSQKFQIGQRVYDARMKAEGTIIYSYHQRYGCGAHEEYSNRLRNEPGPDIVDSGKESNVPQGRR